MEACTSGVSLGSRDGLWFGFRLAGLKTELGIISRDSIAKSSRSPLLRSTSFGNGNVADHVWVKATVIFDIARLLDDDLACFLRQKHYIPFLITGRCRVREEVGVRPFDRITN